MEWIAIWILTVSLLAFVLFGMDKRFAKEKKQRIPEKILFLVSLLGGSMGSLLGMQVFRHKTKHLSFLLIGAIASARPDMHSPIHREQRRLQ